MYKLLRSILFLFDAEKVHHFVMRGLYLCNKFVLTRKIFSALFTVKNSKLETEFLGIKFANPVGLAAGFDKNGQFTDALADCGFGFIEIGTVTPKAQDGNEKPRLFRLKKDQAILNRMGFNNAGMEAIKQSLIQRKNKKIVIGGNIGRNKLTSNEKAKLDYLQCFEALFDHVDYFVVNVSSPNTPNLRELQEREPLQALLESLQQQNLQHTIAKPILLKIAPDLNSSQIDEIIEIVNKTKLDGLVVANTTTSRENLRTDSQIIEKLGAGGVSGKPLSLRSTQMIKYIHDKSNGQIPMIAVGGIHSAQDAIDKLDAGATLVQLYTGFIYEGPALVKSINRALLKRKN